MKPKGLFQKTAGIAAIGSFILAFACLIVVVFWGEELDYASPVFASVLATFFFFVFAGAVLISIWKADLPSLKFQPPKNNPRD